MTFQDAVKRMLDEARHQPAPPPKRLAEPLSSIGRNATLQDSVNRAFADAYAYLEPPMLGEAFGGPKVEPQPAITATKRSAYLMLSVDQQLDAGLITEEQARAQGWTPYVPPPVPWRSRIRRRWQSWRERAGRKIGGWIAGEDLSERDDAW